ncbi:pre-peptidase C-terminal domain-containing protein [Lyngbya sp. CCY1209]|uniref:pre-peptidase C-terminal domain-containing protein n=1 Tax=Lyngbya sp. CCY1209 TaxID=2886103 RepID=UPI002D20ECDA|nr:pre-peptidase C-terminal domain-containing protein [Lyngbya sp. CCY1209]MEB3885592.1 pre-peptidase C-terminal domain-containing protein [Lyngbya sp. CCY1209]
MDTPKKALDLGKVGNDPINHRDNIGFNAGKSKDKNDYYKFKLTGQTNQVNVVLDNLKDNAELQLLDRDGKEILFSSTENGKKRENIDVELDRGTYYLRVYPKGDAKTKYDLSLTAETILQDADGQPEGATNLGPLSKNKKVFNDEIGFDENGTRDNSDYYKFTLTEKFNNLNIVLDGLKDDANIELLDNDGKTILDQSRSKGKNKEIIDGVLDAGTYYVKVEPQGRAKSKYRLSFDSDQIDDPDGTLKRADDLGILRKKPNKQRDEIGFEVGGKRDQKDYYEFTLKKDSEVNLSLDGLNQNADLKLLSRKGDLLYSSANKGKDVEQISTILDRGKYYALVEPVGSDRSEYILSLNADNKIDDPDAQLPGKNLGKLKAKPISKTDDIGLKKKGFVDTSDFWKFELTKETDVTITLDRLSQNADLELYDKDGTTLIYSSKENGKKPEEISSILDKGTYYIKVKPNSGSSTDYKLSVSGNTKIGEQDDALPGTDLGELGTKKVTKRNKVGFESSKNIRDVGDFYNFSLAERSDVNITLDGLTGDANLSLLVTDGRLIDESHKKGKRNETIDAILQPGNYYIGIEPNGGKVKTNYNLGVTANPVNDDFNNIANAKQLGSLDLQDKVAEKNRVGFKQGSLRDAGDYYGFSLSEKANVNLSLDGLKQDANLFLLDAKGKEVDKSTAKGSKAEGIDQKLKPGDYYVAVFPGKNAKTDYELSLGVTRETLDLSSLKFRALDVKDGLNPGEQVKVNYQINNTGNIKADAFEVGFYLSDDEGIDSSDLLLGTAKVKSLSGGKNTKKLSKQLTLPAGEDKFWQGAGDYYLGFVVDSQGAIAEDNELNNTASQKVSVDIPNDLSISNLTTDRETVNPGEEFNVSLTVGNTGGSTADTFRVGYYFSEDNQVTTSDTLLGTDTVKKLAGNTTTNLSKKLTLPSSVSGLTDFYIGAIADDQNAFVEVNETNNTAKKALSLGAVPDDSAGGELKNARDIGVVGEKAQTFSDFVGDFFGVSDDNNDYYKLELDQKSNLNLSLTGLRSNASLYLLDKNGYSIESSTLNGKKNEAISEKLLPGTYYVQVENYNANTPYNLEISAPALSYPAPQITGWNYETALDIGTASSTAIAKTEYVGNPHGFYEDLNDFYKFQVDTDSTVKIDLTGLSANADLSLYDSKEYWSAESHTLKNADENITKNLAPGTYFIEVKSVDNAETTYDLKVTGTSLPNNGAGDTADKALDLGSLAEPKSASDWVGDIDNLDYYQFTVDGNSTVNINLGGMSGDAYLQLYDNTGSYLAYSYNSGNADENITTNLEPGTYFVAVGDSSANTNYDLQLSATPRVDTVGNDFSAALSLGALGSTSQTEWVGSLDTNDYYSFTLAETSTVNLGLTGMNGNGDLYLYDSDQYWIDGSSNYDNADEAISQTLEPGTYYVRVNSDDGTTGADYNLTASATAIVDTAGNTFETARNLGAISAAQTIPEWVGNLDDYDYYQFTISPNSSVSLNLSGLAANADLYLYDSEQNLLDGSYNSDTTDDAITASLGGGTYYALVYQGSDNTNYNFTLSATPLTYSPANLVGNTEPQTKNIGALGATQTFTDFVGSQYGIESDKEDFYQFTLAEDATVSLSLGGLSANADLTLHNSEGYRVASSSNFTTVAEAITQNLVAGTYTVQVNSVEDASTGYNLQLSAIAHPDGAGETFDTARSVDILTGENVNDWVGDIDEYDYYQFTLDANRTVNVQLSGLSQSATLQLYDSSGSSVYYDIDDNSIDSYVDVAPGETGSISALLGPDTYFVSVSGYYSTGDGTNYDLHFSAV